jgi:site-specific DNA recombinase
MENKKKVFGYCRVSTIGQAIDGESLEVQKKKIEDYCKLKDLELLSVYQEQGISGAMAPRQRPLLKKLLANLDAGNADGLVVCKIDRLSRSTKDFLTLMADFKDKYEFYSIVPDMDSSTTHGKFTINLLSIVAELERDMTKDRVKEVMIEKKRKGELVGSVPFGKKLIPDTNILEDDHTEQETILIAKELRSTKIEVNGKMKTLTLKQICEELEKKECKNKDGQSKFFPSQIRRMLYDGKYMSRGRKK